MEAGAHVWIYDGKTEETWLLCEIIKKNINGITFASISATGRPSSSYFTRPRKKGKLGEEELYDGVELANISTGEKNDGTYDDLIALPYLHEPALLHALQERFTKNKIYTWTGPILIAVNPFQRLPLYTEVR